ncbi:hypothetical protein A2U01_0068270, partial [Trifolium medium]|nr:hypothetical protein [Trifolium medium]
GELLAKPSQKVSGFLARRGEKCQTHLAWREDVSPGNTSSGFGAQPSNFGPSHAQIHPKQLIGS